MSLAVKKFLWYVLNKVEFFALNVDNLIVIREIIRFICLIGRQFNSYLEK